MAKAKNIFTATAKCLSLALTYVFAYSQAASPEAALGAAGAAAGAAASGVLGNAVYDLINKAGKKPGEVLLLKSQVELTGAALWRAYESAAGRMPAGEGDFILRDGLRDAESRWRDLMSETLPPELDKLEVEQLCVALAPDDFASLTAYLTTPAGSGVPTLDDAALAAVGALLAEEFPAALLHVLTEPEGEKLYKLDLLGLVSGNRAMLEEILALLRGEARPVSRPLVEASRYVQVPVADFVGRERETEELCATLRRAGRVSLSALQGMGGVGKSELARRVAQKLKKTFPQQIWADMRGTDDHPPDANAALRGLVGALQGPEKTRLLEDAELPGAYREALRRKRHLIILDNARDEAQVLPLLPPSGCALLVTSRNSVPLPGAQTIHLEELPPDKARELLREIAPRVPHDVADQICYLCGYLPLALRAAGSFLQARRDVPPERYAAQLTDERARLEKIGQRGAAVGVEASFNLSYAALEARAKGVFQRLAVFPATFDAEAAAVVCEDAEAEQLSLLTEWSLALYDEAGGRYRLHDLMRIFASTRLSEADRASASSRHAAHYASVLRQANKLYKQGHDNVLAGLRLYDMEAANILAGQGWAAGRWPEDEAAARLCMDYPNANKGIFQLRQTPKEWIVWRELQLSAARKLGEKLDESYSLSGLGIAYRNLGDYHRAIEYNEQSLAIACEIGSQHGEGAALRGLGLAYADLGDSDRAIEYHKQALAIDRKIGDRMCEGADLGNLGIAYKDLGKTHRAIEFFEQSLAIFCEIGDRRFKGYTLGNLGSAYANLGELHYAIEFYEQQLDIAREIGDRRGESDALWNRAVAYDSLGERAQAVADAQAALAIFEAIEDPRAAQVRAQLAAWESERESG